MQLYSNALKLRASIEISNNVKEEPNLSMIHEISLARCARVTLVSLVGVYNHLHLFATNGCQLIDLVVGLKVTDVYNNGAAFDRDSMAVIVIGMNHLLRIPVLSTIKLN